MLPSSFKMLDFFQALDGFAFWGIVLPLMVLGLVLLAFGGDWLADGAASLAVNLRVEPLVIGITVVSVATSAPELFTCLIAGFREQGDSLILGNIAGSNLANIALILGVSAVIHPIAGRPRYFLWEIPWLILASIIFIWSCRGGISQVQGVILLVLMIGYLVVTIRLRSFFLKVLGPVYRLLGIIKNPQDLTIGNFDEMEEIEKKSLQKSLTLVIVGTVILLVGASLLVDTAQVISIKLNVDQGFIGLTVVALGTSLPELAASVAAARKGQTALIAGNIFGSNLFNMLFVGGVTASVTSIGWDGSLKIEMFLMIAVTCLLAFAFQKAGDGKRKMVRGMGLFFIVLYFGILVFSAMSLEPSVK